MIMNGKQIISVRIRGVAFRCATGSRREMILRDLANLDEHGAEGILWGVAGLVIGASIVGAVWYLI